MGIENATKYFSEYYDGCPDDSPDKKKACALLVGAEIATAQKMTAKGEVQGAVEKLQTCVDRTKSTKDSTSICKLYFNLGSLYLHSSFKDYATSIDFYEKYFRIAEKEGNELNCGRVCAALASAYESMGEPKKPVEYLERYLKYVVGHSAEEEAKACQRLGEVYLATQEYHKAVVHLQKYFDIIKEKSNGETPELSAARVRIGIAKANLKTNGFIRCLQSNTAKDLAE